VVESWVGWFYEPRAGFSRRHHCVGVITSGSSSAPILSAKAADKQGASPAPDATGTTPAPRARKMIAHRFNGG
jgi:hypothetical protein